MAKRKKRFTDSDREIAEKIDKRDWFAEDSAWFKDEVEFKKNANKIDLELIEKIKIECRSRADMDETHPDADEEDKKNKRVTPIVHLKDICLVLDWQFPRDKAERTKLAKFSNALKIQHGIDAPDALWNGMMAVITRDHFEDPTDMFLSKKEARKGRKRKKREKVTGERPIKVPMTEEEKKAARKERSRLRREAQKLDITVEEVKKLEAEKEKEPKKEAPKKVARKKPVSRKPATKKNTTEKE